MAESAVMLVPDWKVPAAAGAGYGVHQPEVTDVACPNCGEGCDCAGTLLVVCGADGENWPCPRVQSHRSMLEWEKRRDDGEVDYPSMDGYPETEYGHKVGLLGEDCDTAFILGHVEPLHAVAILQAHLRSMGEGSVYDWTGEKTVADVAALFEHRWARIATNCSGYPNCAGPNPKRDGENRPAGYFDDESPYCRDCDAIATDGWWVVRSEPDAPDAFPVTWTVR